MSVGSPGEGLLTSILIPYRKTLVELEATLLPFHIVTSILLICKLSPASAEASTRIQSQDLLSTIALLTRGHYTSHLQSCVVDSDLFDKERVWVASLFLPRDSLTNKVLPGG